MREAVATMHARTKGEHDISAQEKKRTHDIDDKAYEEPSNRKCSQDAADHPSLDYCLTEQGKQKSRRLEADNPKTLSRRKATEAMQEAISNQRAKKRRHEVEAKAKEESEAIFESDPKLPGDEGGTQAILRRISCEAHGRVTTDVARQTFEACPNSTNDPLASQNDLTGGLLTSTSATRISKGEMHAINNLLKAKFIKRDNG